MTYQKRIATRRKRRGFRVHNRIRRDRHGRMRLSIFRSNKHIYAQVIDDADGRTLASASTTESGVPSTKKGAATGNCQAAAAVGKLIGQRAKEAGVTEVTLDRGRFKYHGRVAALADAAREAGLSF